MLKRGDEMLGYEKIEEKVKVETDDFLVEIRKNNTISINAKQDDYPGTAAMFCDLAEILKAAEFIMSLK